MDVYAPQQRSQVVKSMAPIVIRLLMAYILMLPFSHGYCQDVRFLVDESGSMKVTDPQRLKIPALKLISHLLPVNNVAGIWGFSNKARQVVPMGKVTTKWRALTKRKTHKFNSNGQFTNIGQAIEAVSKDWFNSKTEQERIIILLTDGKIDVSNSKARNLAEKKRVLEQLIPKLRQHNITVYAVGLSDNVDKNLLKELTYRTNGTFQILQSPEQLQDSFYAVFNAAVDSNEVPIINNQFKMDSHISEVTLLLMKKKKQPFSLIMPSGKIYPLDHARIFKTSKYTFITIKKPETGIWKIRGLNSDKNRAIIMSDLGFATRRFNHNFFAGERIVTFAYLTNHGDRLTNELTIKNTEITITPGDSEVIKLNKPTLHEVNFRKDFYLPKNVKGDVTILFEAKSKTFERLKKQLAHIEPFPYEITFRRRNGFEMQAHISTDNTTIVKTKIKAEIKYPTNKEKLVFKKYGAHKYFATYPIMCINEKYTITLWLSGTKLNNDNFTFAPIEFDLECRQKPLLRSYFESTDTNRLILKKGVIKKKKKKKEKKLNYMPYIIPVISTFATLSIISALFLQVRSHRRKKMLEEILDDLHADEEEEDEDEDGDKK